MEVIFEVLDDLGAADFIGLAAFLFVCGRFGIEVVVTNCFEFVFVLCEVFGFVEEVVLMDFMSWDWFEREEGVGGDEFSFEVWERVDAIVWEGIVWSGVADEGDEEAEF